jgi:cation:H+ antiporter
MSIFSSLGIFIFSAILLYKAGGMLVTGLLRLARYFHLKEFVVAFFVMAIASSLPNLFVGITSAVGGIPELSFGDIMGNNLIALTLAVAITVFFDPEKKIPASSQTVRTTSLFTMAAAILPVLLISNGTLTQIDGVILIGLFLSYVVWLFSKKERFSKVYHHDHKPEVLRDTKHAFIDVSKILGSVALLMVAAQLIVYSASSIAGWFNVPIVLIGILILGFGSALPEVYFAVSSARLGKNSLILGNLMGAVIIPATLVLGIVAIIHPIQANNIELFTLSRLFLIIAALFFFAFTYTDKKITSRESYFLLFIYLSFLASVLLSN